MTRLTTLFDVRKIAALTVVAALLLSACGSDDDTTASSTTSSATTSSTTVSDTVSSSTVSDTTASSTTSEAATESSDSAAAFPVTIQHAFGETTIESEPKNVVTVSWQNQDVVLALGVDPIAIPAVAYGQDDKNMYPWFTEALGDQPVPELMDESTGIAFETISLLNPKPDVIIAVYSGLTQEDYTTLSAIAPTVAYPETSYGTDWEDVTTIIGTTLGKDAQAAQLITDTENYISDLGAEYPNLAGKTFAYAYPNPDSFNVYTPSDPRVSLLSGLGLTLAPSVETLTAGATNYFVGVPYENIDQVQSDILILLADDQSAADALLVDPFISALPQVQSGAYAVIVGQQLVMSASAPTVLSIPWGFAQVVPLLSAAADKVA